LDDQFRKVVKPIALPGNGTGGGQSQGYIHGLAHKKFVHVIETQPVDPEIYRQIGPAQKNMKQHPSQAWPANGLSTRPGGWLGNNLGDPVQFVC